MLVHKNRHVRPPVGVDPDEWDRNWEEFDMLSSWAREKYGQRPNWKQVQKDYREAKARGEVLKPSWWGKSGEEIAAENDEADLRLAEQRDAAE